MPWTLQQSGKSKTFSFNAYPAHLSGVHLKSPSVGWGQTSIFKEQESSRPAPWLTVEPSSSVPSDSSLQAWNAIKLCSDVVMNGLFVSLSSGSLFFFPSFFTPHFSSGPKQFSRYGSSHELWKCEYGLAALYSECWCFVGFYFHCKISLWKVRRQENVCIPVHNTGCCTCINRKNNWPNLNSERTRFLVEPKCKISLCQ